MSKITNDLSDKFLLEKYRTGNTVAYNVLFKRYYNSLYSFALKNLKESCVAEELVMDVMMGLWKKKGEIIIEDDLKAYLYRSVKNAIYNHYRKKILPTVSLELVRDHITLTSTAVDYQLNSRELENFYRQKISQLSPQRRKVYELSRDEDMSYAEIAKNLDLSVNTVENYMVASLSFFRKQLNEHADFTLLIVLSVLFN
ncbi:RNA polymerase sigma-70 factor (ECF subfamily) [Pedobacter cryoconitis]|uniref:RNA polymerase sigma-70 factor (ECF subfamily) n=1 Tax=Pedobacter cryoconitis TaxID=188932 RepID=A0A7W9DYD9_9SPHI|nr:RNA polymerase sigma-70 factor [Pedobacter cryoconitis]MBB5636127.1 RNA polymerase sigma-70 factor (ECF subfamily) [Pedobacter cryoconitis]